MTIYFFNDTATTEISTLSLHDALPISGPLPGPESLPPPPGPSSSDWSSSSRRRKNHTSHTISRPTSKMRKPTMKIQPRSEEHTSELQSRQYLVCRLLLEKKKSAIALAN